MASQNLMQKLVQIRMMVKGYTKDVQPQGVKYKSVSGAQVIGMIRDTMDKLNVILVPNITSCDDKESYSQATKYGTRTMYIVRGEMEYIWIDGDNPEDTLVSKWYMLAQQDDPAKAMGSALTYAERYFLMKFFQAPTDEMDPDRFNHQAIDATPVTEAQVNALVQLAASKGFNTQSVIAHISNAYKITDIAKLNGTQYAEVYSALSQAQQQPQAQPQQTQQQAQPTNTK